MREALRELEVIGLVPNQRFRGTWVRGAGDLLALGQALVDLKVATNNRVPIGYSHAIQAFHRRVILMSGNREFLRVWDSQHWAVSTRIAAERVRDRLPQFIAGHTKALDALTAGDGINAGQQLRLLISGFLHAGGALTHAAPELVKGE